MKFLRWLRSVFQPKPTPAQRPSPKPDYCGIDQNCDTGDRTAPVDEGWTPEGLRVEYDYLWKTQRINLIGRQAISTVSWTTNTLQKNKARYKKASDLIEQRLGNRVPWQLIAALHMRESSGDFKKNLMNGQPLGMVTTWVPRGYGPWDSWEESAVDAFRIKSMPKTWTIANTLYFTERYNGMGYRTSSRAAIVGYSPYLWAYTQHYKGGYFVSDGKFSSSAVAMGVGVVVILKELGFMEG
jgi:lysozyme family protein